MEGQIVHAMRHSIVVTASHSKPPQLLIVAAGTLNVGGTEVPLPKFAMRHPAMTATETGLASDSGPEAKTFLIEAPEGEQFYAWIPGLVEVADDGDLVVTRSWELTGIDEGTFRF